MTDWEVRAYCKGLNTYASKKYGANWQEHIKFADIAEEWDKWLDAKDDHKAYALITYEMFTAIIGGGK